MKYKLQMMKMCWLSVVVMLFLCILFVWVFSIDDVVKEVKMLVGKGYEVLKSNLFFVFCDMKYVDYQ